MFQQLLIDGPRRSEKPAQAPAAAGRCGSGGQVFAAAAELS
jgi:hypothetical protein